MKQKNMTSQEKKEKRQLEAKQRQAAYDALSIEEKRKRNPKKGL